jgi:fucose 4-O-acetylase-like acetyltransferase
MRTISFDIMKGIGILLMMYCHIVQENYNIIYSFHMPMFFILSGYFVKDENTSISNLITYIKNRSKRLLLPLIVTLLFLCVWGVILWITKDDMSFLKTSFLSIFWLGADILSTPSGNVTIYSLWFLISLFWIGLLFNNCRVRYKNLYILISCIILSASTSFIVNFFTIPPLPFSLLQAFTALVFYAIGWYVKRCTISKELKWICILSWPLALYFGEIELYSCYYKLFILDVLGACGATLLLFKICRFIENKINNNLLSSLPFNFLSWCGVNSLLILCMHELEMRTQFVYSIICRFPADYECVLRGVNVIHFILPLFMAMIILKIPYLNKVYR